MNESFYLTDDQRTIRDLARKIARERVAPNTARYDEAEAGRQRGAEDGA